MDTNAQGDEGPAAEETTASVEHGGAKVTVAELVSKGHASESTTSDQLQEGPDPSEISCSSPASPAKANAHSEQAMAPDPENQGESREGVSDSDNSPTALTPASDPHSLDAPSEPVFPHQIFLA